MPDREAKWLRSPVNLSGFDRVHSIMLMLIYPPSLDGERGWRPFPRILGLAGFRVQLQGAYGGQTASVRGHYKLAVFRSQEHFFLFSQSGRPILDTVIAGSPRVEGLPLDQS